MTIKKVDGYATVHCHGKDKGKIIHKFKTKKEAAAAGSGAATPTSTVPSSKEGVEGSFGHQE